MKAFIILIFLIIVPETLLFAADPEKIILWEHIWHQRESIQLILDKSVDSFGPYELVKSIKMEQGRAIHSLNNNTYINLLILPVCNERTETLLPVYLYMRGALMGYRVCLIRKGSQYKFDQIQSLEDWHKSGLTMGTVTHWVDTNILKKNNMAFVCHPVYEPLYKMLAAGRFDCFPRGIDQIKRKLDAYGPEGLGLDIEIEKRLLFLSFKRNSICQQKNPRLKERLLKGYEVAVKDQSWTKHIRMLSQHEFHKERFSHLNLKNRIFIPLNNPDLPDEALKLKTYDCNPLE